MIERHLAKLRARDDISAEEEEAIRWAVADYREYPSRKTIIPAEQELTFSTLLLSGMLARFKDLRSGGRQITELHVAGDFADLHSFTLKRLDHAVETLGPCKVALVPHDRLREITVRYPHLTRVYWFTTNLDAAIHREWVFSLGQRRAQQRMAQLFCEMHIKLSLVGLVENGSYDLPLTQEELGQVLGLTSVHVNRTLQLLREQGTVEFRSGRVTIFDVEQLRHSAEFDPSYLYLEKRPR
ncbi:Crp/Fnr family transcriptional regulator [Sphingomonas sp. GCM10030256]|uniref:Crp/Fnr family transcriptional regulator n=1 Tax=Sphingomonas sp. GCM10030256 TaxID=3273427 RepID=UPI00360FCB1D